MTGPVCDQDTTAIALTLVICTYNNAASLEKTLKHIEAQGSGALRDCAVLVIDNNCSDATAEVVASAQARGNLPGLRRILEPRQGLVFARLRGVTEAASEWIAFIDDDNLMLEGWIANAKRLIGQHPRCGAFGGRIEISWAVTPPDVVRRNDYAYASLDLGPKARQLQGEDRWHLRGAGLVCRASVLDSAGWMAWQGCTGRQRGATTSGDDLEIVMRIAREGYEIWYEPACKLRHLISASRISVPYLERLHFGFGMAHPILVGFKHRQDRARWSFRLLRSMARDVLRVIKRGLESVNDPVKLTEARLTWAYLHGTICGIPLALSLGRWERRIWLGQATAKLSGPPRLAGSDLRSATSQKGA
jgi:glycosyltransferase involved in cell wall biosynthesis